MKRAAAAALADHMINVRNLVAELDRVLAKESTDFQAQGATDLGYTGSMEHAEELIREAVAFLKGIPDERDTDKVIAA